MSGSSRQQPPVIPAQLSFLAIYNPSLGTTEETLGDQIVFYSSTATYSRRAQRSGHDGGIKDSREEENEKLRQVGLAQGMVDFAKNFSGGNAVNSIETEKARIVLHELESGWWILASIDLTRLPANHTSISSKPKADSNTSPKIEYSAREVSPPELVLQELLRAHRIFLLHHAETLDGLSTRLPRNKFCAVLDRFWTKFIWNWNILLQGNPSSDIFDGLKLAAGGELGMGVGEEEWGSGEREVLEDFVTRTDGLVDLIVSRFGDEPPKTETRDDTKEKPNVPSDAQPWLGLDICPRPGDGVIFSGIGAISRESLRDISRWMEWIYKYGEDAYGVRDNPGSTHRRKRRKPRSNATEAKPSTVRSSQRHTETNQSQSRDRSPGIPPPIVSAAERSLQQVGDAASSRSSSRNRTPLKSDDEGNEEPSLFGTDVLVKYLTLGYGSSWSLTPKPSHQRVSALRQQKPKAESTLEKDELKEMQTVDPTPEISEAEEEEIAQEPEYTIGRYIIGLLGDLENDTVEEEQTRTNSREGTGEFGNLNNRTLLRTLTVKLPKNPNSSLTREDESDSIDQPSSDYKKIQVVVYLHQPFMFTFLFELRTTSLSYPSFYRDIHHQLGPLQKPLLSSTSPAKVQERIFASAHARTTSAYPNLPIYDLVYDPHNLTVHTSIPNIPEPGTPPAEDLAAAGTTWTRIEALNVHTQILNTYSNTRNRLPIELERTCKTSRGWWIVWMRLPPFQNDKEQGTEDGFREAFLVRRASDYVSASSTFAKKVSGSSKWLRDISGSSTGSAVGGTAISPGKVAEGIGIDARKYVEGLLSLNR